MGIEEQDDLLRQALASYAAHEPRSGIEERVLRRVRAPRLVRRSGWALAWLAAAGVIVTMMVPREETLVVPLPALVTPPPVVVKAIERPDRFPSPAPLTREERTLLALADSPILAGSGTGEIMPIKIDEITIPPIGE